LPQERTAVNLIWKLFMSNICLKLRMCILCIW